jgi:opacity protein-like surface antigen
MTLRMAVGVLVLLLAGPVLASDQDDAEARNRAGRALFEARDHEGAAREFRAAIALVPDARYHFNLCVALERLGDLRGAIAACDQVALLEASDGLRSKASVRAARMRKTQADAPPIEVGEGGARPGGREDLPPPPQAGRQADAPTELPLELQGEYRMAWGFAGYGTAAGTFVDGMGNGTGVALWMDLELVTDGTLGLRLGGQLQGTMGGGIAAEDEVKGMGAALEATSGLWLAGRWLSLQGHAGLGVTKVSLDPAELDMPTIAETWWSVQGGASLNLHASPWIVFGLHLGLAHYLVGDDSELNDGSVTGFTIGVGLEFRYATTRVLEASEALE